MFSWSVFSVHINLIWTRNKQLLYRTIPLMFTVLNLKRLGFRIHISTYICTSKEELVPTVLENFRFLRYCYLKYGLFRFLLNKILYFENLVTRVFSLSQYRCCAFQKCPSRCSAICGPIFRYRPFRAVSDFTTPHPSIRKYNKWFSGGGERFPPSL